MDHVFGSDYEERFLSEAAYANGEDEDGDENGASEEYYDLPLALRSRSLIPAVISLVFGILSLVLCPIYYISLIFAANAIIFSLVSRKNLGFFEKYSIIGLILGMMGIVCGIFSLIIDLTGIFG